MKRFLFAMVLVVLISGMAAAQDFPRFEIYGGYAAQRLGLTDSDLAMYTTAIEDSVEGIGSGYTASVTSSRFLKMGFEGAFTVNVNSVFGIVVDVRYNRDDIISGSITGGEVNDVDLDMNIRYTDLAVLAGPRFAFRNSERVTPFFHALVGMDQGEISGDATVEGTPTNFLTVKDKGLGFAFGGGFDVNLGDTVALRLAQVDYYMTRHNEEFLKNVAFSGGIVFRFGWWY